MNETTDAIRERVELGTILVEERAKGNVVFASIDGLHTAALSDFVSQPADGILYDLNRLEEVALTLLGTDPQWINNFAVALVIRELKAQLDAKSGNQGA